MSDGVTDTYRKFKKLEKEEIVTTFEQWWSKNAFDEADILPVYKVSFKAIAKIAWEAALYNNNAKK